MHRITLPLAHSKTVKKNSKPEEMTGDLDVIKKNLPTKKAFVCAGLLLLEVVCLENYSSLKDVLRYIRYSALSYL